MTDKPMTDELALAAIDDAEHKLRLANLTYEQTIPLRQARRHIATRLAQQPARGGEVDDEVSDALTWLEQCRGTVMYDRTAALIRALAQPRTEQPAAVYSCPECGTGMEIDPTAKPAAEGPGEVATIHSDGYWTHPDGRDPFDRHGPNQNKTSMPVYAGTPPRADAEMGERFDVLRRIWIRSAPAQPRTEDSDGDD